ncbi:MAG: YciI family protein [Aquamicrobium sp.]|uniref:YciI family protein n=1 Tax=Aquamicrobium sp. TaxID=1872579 RepID=UPI00349EC8C0|nr:YciI family protein [Aquamicrobium sp.]
MTAENDDTAAIAELMRPMMKRELYVILNRPLVPMAEMRRHLHAHLVYMIELEQSGVLFASGPLSEPGGEMAGEGLTIVRAASLAEAEAIAGRDPFVLAGQREPQVRKWTVNEGRITVSVDISTATAALP